MYTGRNDLSQGTGSCNYGDCQVQNAKDKANLCRPIKC
jgi:hypothetical protein